MAQTFNFYMDDSGTRHPDRNIDLDGERPDYFALGGILIRDDDEDLCRRKHEEFYSRWSQLGQNPLHSCEIRSRKDAFRWLADDPATANRFFAELDALLLNLPLIGHACVIDRRGYHRRYHERYGTNKWSLCKTAFDIAVERACKFAARERRKLNIYVERSDKKADNKIQSYFEALKVNGHAFDPKNSAKYDPLGPELLRETLYDLKLKNKSSPMMQLADLYLYPIAIGRYRPEYTPYQALKHRQRLLDTQVDDAERHGIKYSCFENVGTKN